MIEDSHLFKNVRTKLIKSARTVHCYKFVFAALVRIKAVDIVYDSFFGLHSWGLRIKLWIVERDLDMLYCCLVNGRYRSVINPGIIAPLHHPSGGPVAGEAVE